MGANDNAIAIHAANPRYRGHPNAKIESSGGRTNVIVMAIVVAASKKGE